MRKVALFAALALSVALLSTSSSVPASAQQQQDFCSLNKGTCLFMQGPGGPGAPAATAPAAGKKVAKKGGKKKKA